MPTGKKSTLEYFIQQSKQKFGNKFNFDKAIFTRTCDKIELYCNDCQKYFFITPNSHLATKTGCSYCGIKENTKKRFLTSEEFLKKCISIFGDQHYNFQAIKYESAKKEFTLHCNICNLDFITTARSLFQKHGCPYCSKSRVSKQEFIKRSKESHTIIYNYDNVSFSSTQDKISIECPKHGVFLQYVDYHMAGGDCPKCARPSYKRNTEEFIQKCKDIYGNKFLYTKTKYNDCLTPVIVECPEHGEIEILPVSFLKGRGCVKCKNKSNNAKLFLENAKIKHNNFYDYTKFIYEYGHNKSCIICPIHGEFYQTPNGHLSGAGCPKCKASKGEREIQKYLDKNKIYYIHQYRIKECRIKKPLPFDFAIFEDEQKLKLKMLIEFDGEFHYETFHVGDQTLLQEKLYKTKIRDEFKNKFCNDNNIKLVRIPYWNKQNIQEILSKLLL